MNYFLKHICNQKWNIQQDAGRLIKDGEKDLISQFPKYTKEIQMFYPNHHKMIKGTFQNSIDQLLELKSQNYLCYVLSNWSAETFVGMKDDYSFLNKFDGIIISGENKLIKPDKAIYKLAISRFDLIPDTTVFIEEALHRLVEVYYRLGLEEEAKQAAIILGYNYKSGEWYERSYKVFNKKYKSKKFDKEKEMGFIRRKIKGLFE